MKSSGILAAPLLSCCRPISVSCISIFFRCRTISARCRGIPDRLQTRFCGLRIDFFSMQDNFCWVQNVFARLQTNLYRLRINVSPLQNPIGASQAVCIGQRTSRGKGSDGDSPLVLCGAMNCPEGGGSTEGLGSASGQGSPEISPPQDDPTRFPEAQPTPSATSGPSGKFSTHLTPTSPPTPPADCPKRSLRPHPKNETTCVIIALMINNPEEKAH